MNIALILVAAGVTALKGANIGNESEAIIAAVKKGAADHAMRATPQAKVIFRKYKITF